MKVKRLMNTKPLTAGPQTSYFELWKKIFEKNVSGLPIIDKNNFLLGIISEEDLIEELYPSYDELFFDPQYLQDFEEIETNLKDVSNLKAEDFMNKSVFTTTLDTPIMKAAASMLINKVSCLPVVKNINGKKKLMGIICKVDIFSHLFENNISSKIKKGKS